jgi:hypothetical protein
MLQAVKLPPESLATTVFDVFALVALTVQVIALDPLKGDPLRYVPAVNGFETWVEMPLKVALT